MRIATYNIEWFNALFEDDGWMIDDDSWSGRWNVTKAQQTHAIARVLKAIDADAIMVIEAPDTSKFRDSENALERFAHRFKLRTSKALLGFVNDTQQEIALLYDPKVMSAKHSPGSSARAPQFDQEFLSDFEFDDGHHDVVWSKPPLEVTLKAGQHMLQLIGVHAKSKAPHGAKNDAEAKQISIANRRKQLAQCTWLRRRVDERMAQGHSVLVMGDFNDGPGLDEYEELFGQSGVEIVLGSEPATKLFDPHAAHALRSRFAAPTTSRFWLAREKRYLQALLDYIMVSPDIRNQKPVWRIWHPFEDHDCCEDKALQEALLLASDHFPVTIDL